MLFMFVHVFVFTDQSEQALKLTKEELEIININIEQDKRELKIRTLIGTSERENLILLPEYVDVFT